ncbi:hypothetical protein GALMADRAFT_1141038 [Galerina marginata CBS 339.88]|uniref:Uncharacterized protein n=1 Tax=Galerina marginata (strain CBS 339.88) TaxID=685588 RepID=A0A067SGC8_GALM3|nr:hypothetical protein GALMADRAFT_1141038 [Galerina marginata CBS 339.88]
MGLGEAGRWCWCCWHAAGTSGGRAGSRVSHDLERRVYVTSARTHTDAKSIMKSLDFANPPLHPLLARVASSSPTIQRFSSSCRSNRRSTLHPTRISFFPTVDLLATNSIQRIDERRSFKWRVQVLPSYLLTTCNSATEFISRTSYGASETFSAQLSTPFIHCLEHPALDLGICTLKPAQPLPRPEM